MNNSIKHLAVITALSVSPLTLAHTVVDSIDDVVTPVNLNNVLSDTHGAKKQHDLTNSNVFIGLGAGQISGLDDSDSLYLEAGFGVEGWDLEFSAAKADVNLASYYGVEPSKIDSEEISEYRVAIKHGLLSDDSFDIRGGVVASLIEGTDVTDQKNVFVSLDFKTKVTESIHFMAGVDYLAYDTVDSFEIQSVKVEDSIFDELTFNAGVHYYILDELSINAKVTRGSDFSDKIEFGARFNF
ncbi:conserved exported hypothetical protein [Vibrio chagasii]|nr:conserved exported hypothetical protein [Vibrio chagasii]